VFDSSSGSVGSQRTERVVSSEENQGTMSHLAPYMIETMTRSPDHPSPSTNESDDIRMSTVTATEGRDDHYFRSDVGFVAASTPFANADQRSAVELMNKCDRKSRKRDEAMAGVRRSKNSTRHHRQGDLQRVKSIGRRATEDIDEISEQEMQELRLKVDIFQCYNKVFGRV